MKNRIAASTLLASARSLACAAPEPKQRPAKPVKPSGLDKKKYQAK